MSFPKIKELLVANLNDDQLEQEIIKIKRQIFDLRLKKSTRQTFQPHSFKHARHKLSQLLMLKSNLTSQTYIADLNQELNLLSKNYDLNIKLKFRTKE